MAARPAVAVLGAGAVGGYLGAKIAASLLEPHHVTLIGRPTLVDAINSDGLVLHEDALSRAEHLTAVSDAESTSPADLTIFTVRTFDVAAAIPQARYLMGETGMLLAMQNGVGTEEDLAEALGRERMLAGTLTVSVAMDQPGVINRLSSSGGIALSTMDGSSVPVWVTDLFRATDIPTALVADYRALRWSKLLLNMLGAATTSILNIDMASLARDPSLFRLEQRAFREAGRVTDAQGIDTVDLPGYPVRLARMAMRLPSPIASRLIGPRMARARGGRASGMRRDLKRNRTEMANLNGAVVKAGRQTGVPTPVNEVLCDLMMDLAEHPEDRDGFDGNPDRLLSLVRTRGVRI